MNALAFLLHIDASISDPREPLKLLIKYGCDPRKRVRIADRKVFSNSCSFLIRKPSCLKNTKSDVTSTDASDDEDFKPVEYQYDSFKKCPKKFNRSIAHVLPECQNTWPELPKWAKKEKVKLDVDQECYRERNRRHKAMTEESKLKQHYVTSCTFQRKRSSSIFKSLTTTFLPMNMQF